MAELNYVYFYATKSASQPEMRALCHKRLIDISKFEENYSSYFMIRLLRFNKLENIFKF